MCSLTYRDKLATINLLASNVPSSHANKASATWLTGDCRIKMLADLNCEALARSLICWTKRAAFKLSYRFVMENN